MNKEAGFSYTPDTEFYHTDFINTLQEALGNSLEIKKRKFNNDMPLYLVEGADHVMYVTWINGDNFAQAFTDMCLSGVGFTYDADAAGANVKRLGMIFPFFDARQDKRTRKPVPDSLDHAIVKNQAVTNEAIARAVGKVAQASYVITLDTHSYDTRKRFEANGVEFLNVTAARPIVETLRERNLLTDNLKTTVATTDLGDLSRALAVQKLIPEAELAIVLKDRIISESGTESIIQQKLVYGDVRGKRVILFDDLLSSGKTAEQGKDLMLDHGACEVIVCVTHPVCVGDYYNNVREILADSRVPMVLTTDSLPFEKRRSGGISVPYIEISPGVRKELTVIPIAPFMARIMHHVLTQPSIEQAREYFKEDILDVRDPYDVFLDIVGYKLSRPQDVAQYNEGQIFPLT